MDITILRLTDTHTASPGPCACCEKPAVMWHRRATDQGIMVAALACRDHTDIVVATLGRLTIVDVASLVPASSRRRIAESSRRQAARHALIAEKYGHTHLGSGEGYHTQTASALVALADALEALA